MEQGKYEKARVIPKHLVDSFFFSSMDFDNTKTRFEWEHVHNNRRPLTLDEEDCIKNFLFGIIILYYEIKE